MQQIHQLIISGIDISPPRLHSSKVYFFFSLKQTKKMAQMLPTVDQLFGLLHTSNHYNKECILSAMPNLRYFAYAWIQ